MSFLCPSQARLIQRVVLGRAFNIKLLNHITKINGEHMMMAWFSKHFRGLEGFKNPKLSAYLNTFYRHPIMHLSKSGLGYDDNPFLLWYPCESANVKWLHIDGLKKPQIFEIWSSLQKVNLPLRFINTLEQTKLICLFFCLANKNPV